MSVEGQDGAKALYSGKANAIDNNNECQVKRLMLTFKSERVKKFVDKDFKMKMQVEIRCLKDEAKDEDIESGVSDVDD